MAIDDTTGSRIMDLHDAGYSYRAIAREPDIGYGRGASPLRGATSGV